jgi:hypothetical protein
MGPAKKKKKKNGKGSSKGNVHDYTLLSPSNSLVTLLTIVFLEENSIEYIKYISRNNYFVLRTFTINSFPVNYLSSLGNETLTDHSEFDFLI